METKVWTTEEVITVLNELQKQRFIKITNYENLEISLRAKLEKEVVINIDEWIKEWTELWKGKYSGSKPSGYYLAQSISDNRKRMVEFLKENPDFTKEIIIKATVNYLSEKEQVNFDFCKKSAKFIQSEDGSTLYAYAVQVLHGEENVEKDKLESI